MEKKTKTTNKVKHVCYLISKTIGIYWESEGAVPALALISELSKKLNSPRKAQ